MPGYDRSGPMGQGPMTGRGMGRCNDNKSVGQARPGFYGYRRGGGRGFGRNARRGFGPGFGFGRAVNDTEAAYDNVDRKKVLEDQQAFLEDELAAVKAELKKEDE